MKRPFVSLVLFGSVTISPLFAKESGLVFEEESAGAVVTAHGRLAVSPELMNADWPQIYVSHSGKVVSPRPTDRAKLGLWMATQVWLNDSIERLDRAINFWAREFHASPTGTTFTEFANVRLWAYLGASGAVAEINAIAEAQFAEATSGTNSGAVDLEGPGSTDGAAPQGCGPKGVCMNVVWCCVRTCDPFNGCDEDCDVCDCDPNCAGCCGYNLDLQRK